LFIPQRNPDRAARTGGNGLCTGASDHRLHPRTGDYRLYSRAGDLDDGLHNPIATIKSFRHSVFRVREDNGMTRKSVLTEATNTVVSGAKEVETFAKRLATAAIVAAADAVSSALASTAKPKKPVSKSRTKQAAKKRPVVTAKKKAAKKSPRKSAKKKAAPKRGKR
jgi:hypothetical protein